MDKRLGIFQVFLILILVYVVFHIISITLFDPYGLEHIMEYRHTTGKELKYYHRGDIYDRNGDMLVTTQYNYQLDLDKGFIHRKLKAAKDEKGSYEERESYIYDVLCEVVSKYSKFGINQLKDHISQVGNSSIFIDNNFLVSDIVDIKREVINRIEGDTLFDINPQFLKEAFITTRVSEKRIYPYENLAPRLLGLALPDTMINSPDEYNRKKQLFHLKGLCGIEKTFEEYLSGQDGWEETLFDAMGNKVLKPSLEARKPQNGLDIYLTINRQYQEILELKLRKGLNKFKAKNAMGVIMDVHTGEILALAGEHENDQNLPVNRLRSYSNLPVSYCMEPGSTMKPITALLALENNLFAPDELIDCSPLVQKYATQTRTIRDHHEFDKLTLEDIIVESSNPGISRVAQEVGEEKLYNRLDEMGLGRKTLSKIYGESNGILRDLNKWGEYSLSSISFGQEISLNMLHMAVIYSVFANGGKILRPQILSYCTDADSIRYNELTPTEYNTISQPYYIKQIQKFLRNVVTKGTAKETDLDYIEISGKTGTSEIITVGENGKVETRHNSLFAGYLPSDDPQIVIIIAFDRCMEDEHKYYYASQSAVPIFREVVESIVVLPDCELMKSNIVSSDEKAVLPNLVGLNKAEAEIILKQNDLKYEFVNYRKDGIISDQHPPANMKFNKNHTVKLALAEQSEKITDKKLMPDFKGLTLREACDLARDRLIEITANGYGIVCSQSIPPYSEISLEDACHLYLE